MYDSADEFMAFIFIEYYDGLRVQGYRFLRGRYDNSEDIVHDALAKVMHVAKNNFDNIREYEPDRLRGWLSKVMYNRMKQSIYKNLTHYSRHQYLPNDDIDPIAFEDPYPGWEFEDGIAIGLQKLKGTLKDVIDEEVFQDLFINDLSEKEIAEKRNLSLGVVRGRSYRMRKKLKKYLINFFSIFACILVLLMAV